jgi:hypothetical protein
MTACSRSLERTALSSSEKPTTLRIEGAAAALEVTLLNSNLEQVASSVGGLEAEIEPGLYELHFREASEQQTQLLKVGPGEERTVSAPDFEISSPAPLAGTSTSHEYHEQPVRDATTEIATDCAGPGAATGGMIVMVRNLAGQEQLSFPDCSASLGVVDANLEPVGKCGRWEQDTAAGWAVWRAALAPGGYALRMVNPDGEVLYQSLWVDEGWQLLMFIPNTSDGPAADLATIHLARVGEWSPDPWASEAGIALESVLDGLRSRRSVIPQDLTELFDAKFSNPFLGIAAAHALMLDPNRSSQSLSLLETVLRNLRRLVPASPDVAALEYRAADLEVPIVPQPGLSWPPIFYAGYRTLLRADAGDPAVIADDSLAERVAPMVRLAGLWTTWAEAPRQARARGAAPAPDVATERVRTYLEGAAEVQGRDVSQMLKGRTVEQLALATGLPANTAAKAMETLKEEL